MQNMPRKSRENNFMALLNFIVDPAVIVDEKGHILLVNIALENLTGLSKKELIGKSFFELSNLAAESKASLLEKLMKRMQGLSVEPYEITFTDKTGETRYVEVKAKKINYAGQPVDLVIFRDITRRKQNAKRLKEYAEKMEALVNEKVKEIEESEEKYRELTESISDVFFAMDKDLRYTYWNEASEKLTGILAKDAIGKSLTEVFPDVKGTGVEQFYQEALRTKQSQSFLNKHRIGDKDFVFEINAYPTMAGLSVFVKDITERKKREEALRESEEKYRTQFEEALDAIFVADAETGIIIDCNRAASELVDREKSELVGKHQRILHPPEEIEGDFSRTFKQHLKEKEGQVLETQVITKRGEIKDVAIKANVIELRGKKLIQGIFRDITERKKIEAAVAYERDLLHALMDNIPDTIYFKDVASHFTRINRAQALCLRAKDPEEAIGKTDFDYYAEEFAREAYTDEQRILKARKPLVEKVEKVKWRDGKSRWVSATKVPIIDKDGRITGLVGISRDITEIKKMEEKLRQYSEHLEELVQKRTEELLESEKRYSVLVEEASDGITIVQDGKIVFVNKKTSEIAGYSRDELIGLSLEKLVDEKYHQLVKERYMRRMRGETVPATYEVEFIAKTSERVPVEVSVACIRYQGRPADLTIVRDVRERKRMEGQRLKLEKLASIGELATMVGHDLRNPLQSIENAVYYLKNECAPKLPVSIPQKAKEMFQVISDSVDYADKIIRDLQDFSAIKTPRLEKTDINAMIKETLSRVHIPNNIELRTELGAIPEINVDKDEIKRVFMNLTTNGIQAMENGGTLTVATKKTEGFVEVSFKDTGIGISKENMERLFTPFFTTKAKGMGIGLSICKKFVESHGGSIEVESEVGKGTAFTVKLPIHQEGGGEKT